MSQPREITDPLIEARVWTELGELQRAEAAVAGLLEGRPEDLEALSLLAKIKHMRGELSAAVACWAHIHARSPHSEQTHLHLLSMLHLAQDPERGAGEFLALGQGQLMRKPAAYLALEEAFHLFVARRPEMARAHCRAVAAQRPSRDLYKLAVLAEAWIAELSGQLEEGCRVLEALGAERGFEHDVDRVIALARMYEALGTPERLAAATNIYRFLERSVDPLPVLGRLAALYRRLGQEALAREYEQRQTRAFRAGMQRPTVGEVVHVAARRYLPLSRLRAHRFAPDAERPAQPAPREAALYLALEGELAGAERALAAGSAPLDQKYRADLAALRGDTEQAARRYREVFAEDPTDLDVLAWLLERHAADGDPATAALLRERTVAQAALTALQSDLAVSHAPATAWRRLALFHALFPDHHKELARARKRAATHEKAERRHAQATGCALAAGVYHFVGKAKGLIHQVWVTRERADGHGGRLPQESILGNLTPEMRQQVLNTFVAVRSYAQAKFPHLTEDLFDYDYTFKVTKDDEPSGGTSAGLPAALAFLSVFLQRPLPQDTAFTGVIVADAHDVLVVRRVGDIEHKVKGAYHRNLRRLLVPTDNRPELEASGLVPREITEELVRYVSTLDQAARASFGDALLAESRHPPAPPQPRP